MIGSERTFQGNSSWLFSTSFLEYLVGFLIFIWVPRWSVVVNQSLNTRSIWANMNISPDQCFRISTKRQTTGSRWVNINVSPDKNRSPDQIKSPDERTHWVNNAHHSLLHSQWCLGTICGKLFFSSSPSFSFFSAIFLNCKNQIVDQNLRIVAHWWTLCESHLLRLYFGIFQPSVV